MRAQARSLERLQREAERAAQQAGTLVDEENAASDFEGIDNYNFSDGSENGDALAEPAAAGHETLPAPAALQNLSAPQAVP